MQREIKSEKQTRSLEHVEITESIKLREIFLKYCFDYSAETLKVCRFPSLSREQTENREIKEGANAVPKLVSANQRPKSPTAAREIGGKSISDNHCGLEQ